MEFNTETEMKQQRPQESLPSTPVAKKTRSSVRQQKFDNDDFLGALPKTPSAITSTRSLCETPRRSARKSIRPPMDYEDIVENNLMRSVSKKDKDILATADAAEEEDTAVPKWNAAEVGRHSRKRSRKSKRAASKKAKREEEECTEDVEEQEETLTMQDKKEGSTKDVEGQEKTLTMQDQKEEICSMEEDQKKMKEQEVKDLEEVKMLQDVKEQETEPQEKVLEQKKMSLETDSQLAQLPETQPEVKEQFCIEKIHESKVEAVEEIEKIIVLSSPEVADSTAIKSMERSLSLDVAIVDLDELGLCPITADDDEKPDDEMPSLIMLDDEDEADDLNRTFEIGDKPTEDPKELNAVEQPIKDDIEMPNLRLSPEKPIKIVLTNEYDQDKTLLRMKDSLKSPNSSAFRFPTPFKNTSKINFKFTDGNLTQHSELDESCRSRRRSKSVCGDTTRNVTFYSPIEVVDVSDIDKRLEKFNKNHVTQRRKRSKSLDAPFVSKLRQPSKPKFFPVIKGPTPIKLKTRTNMPNFAAIHEKQFNKMESLVDHVERKAVRAKELTNSARKLITGNLQSAQKSSAKKLPASSTVVVNRQRPKAIKKILLPSDLLTPMKPEEIQRMKNLPTPRNIIVVQPKSRLPLLAKSVTKIFSGISTVPAPVPALAPVPSSSIRKAVPAAALAPAPIQSKLDARRQRHMEMFKGRTKKENKGDLIRGVRSNRRFELQMQHRRQMDENNT